MTATLTVAEGYDAAAVRAAAKTALEALFSADLLGKGISRAAIGDALYHTAGVENYTLTAPEEDIAAAQAALPVLGSVTLTAEG